MDHSKTLLVWVSEYPEAEASRPVAGINKRVDYQPFTLSSWVKAVL